MTRQTHGGDRYRNDVKLDFSVNTNPMGMPESVRHVLQAAASSPDIWCGRYPDRECSGLREALAARHGTAKEGILCGNGASELIYAIVNAAGRGAEGMKRTGGAGDGERTIRALLPVPSFAEYERALQAAGAQIRYHVLEEENGFALSDSVLDGLTPDTDLVFLCNPNNPVGNLLPEGLLLEILERCRESEITVVLDECFLELAVPERGAEGRERSAGRVGRLTERFPNLIFLKAFTKLYAMPGLRLGYCIGGDRALISGIKRQLPCWNVSGIAQLAGMTALDNEYDVDYISQSRNLIAGERAFLADGLKALGMDSLPGCANFICFRSPAGYDGDLYEALLRKKILIRDCSSFRGMAKGWYRIAVRPRRENEILLEELRSLLQ